MDKMNTIDIKNLNARVGDFTLKIDSLTVSKGEKIALLGENGAGKSTLLDIISGVNKNFTGELNILNKQISNYKPIELANLISYLPQFSEIIFGFDVFDTVLFGRYPKTSGKFEDYDFENTKEWLKKLDIYHLKDRKFNELSGGEKKRVMLARVLNQDTDIILLDEPFSMLDVKHTKIAKEILVNEKKSIILSSHDINILKYLVDEIVFLKKGEVLCKVNIDNLNKEILNEVFEVDFKCIDGFYFVN
ncbi:ABC transporter ATP-binding protein [Calditerrivibrio nitroreducens]|uniref:ABC transporter related protein n=1 Tax=Calditerrivibrio nitroreducens (strain DSM 19672 / NBRC 101217 / Yu37-1) TaxID=768670 RepID=E4TKD1_CALNY|nr:ABC transporter ATP-binding protein [Calditerrivibrio nitroreducens]ADR20003.1 ABC transporter related protein [Calditerrivibrio nitroreducens DSM 19672]